MMTAVSALCREVARAHHWWLIDPDNPGPKQRAKAMKQAAREYGAEVFFVGRTEMGTWFALFYAADEDEDAVYKAIGGQGNSGSSPRPTSRPGGARRFPTRPTRRPRRPGRRRSRGAARRQPQPRDPPP